MIASLFLTSVSGLTHISDCTDLQNMALNLAEDYVLDNNINCSATSGWNGGLGFIPVGNVTAGAFTGTLNGNNHTISDLFINRAVANSGLFGQANGCAIRNVGLVDVDITGSESVGALVGQATNCIVNQTYSTGAIDATVNGIVGGLAGSFATNGLINNSFSNCTITTPSNSAGGLVGQLNGFADIWNSYSTGNVTADSQAGGLVGQLADGGTTITNSFATGWITAPSWFAGGLVGNNGVGAGAITASYWFNRSSDDALNCYSTGNSGCTPQTPITYFFDITNAPMSSWDFPPWGTRYNTTFYPPLWLSATTSIRFVCNNGYTYIPFLVWVRYLAPNGTVIRNATIRVWNATNSYYLTYNPAHDWYEETFMSYTNFTWRINITSSRAGFETITVSCSPKITRSFNATIRLWEEVGSTTYAATTKYTVRQPNYNRQLTDPYINDFAWIIAKSNGLNASWLYNTCALPIGTGQGIMGALNYGNWMPDALKNLFREQSGGLIGCNDYWIRDEYRSGSAQLRLPWKGTYSLYLLEGTAKWESNWSPPQIIKSNMFIYLGELNVRNMQNQTVDIYISHAELNSWGWLSDTIFAAMTFVLPILIFLVGAIYGIPLQLIGIIIIFWEAIWFGMNIL